MISLCCLPEKVRQVVSQFPGFGEVEVRVLVAVNDIDPGFALAPSLSQAHPDARACHLRLGQLPVGPGLGG